MFQSFEIAWIVFLHQAVAVGAGKIEDVVWILFKQGEIVAQGLRQVFTDGLRILPTPFRIKVGIADNVKRPLIGQIGPGWSSLCRGIGPPWLRGFFFSSGGMCGLNLRRV